MKADSFKISKVFSGGGDIHYVLPHFQREYSWDKEHWKTLLSDVISIYNEYDSEQEPEHFLGAIVVINDGTRNGVIPAFKLVDGQQRLTTISILLCALHDILMKEYPSEHKALSKKIKKMLVNPDEENDLYFKVWPTTKYGDRQAYIDMIRGNRGYEESETESNIPKAYEYFYKEIKSKLAIKEILADLFFVVLSNCFQVIFIDLNKDESPYKIFESLNAKGKKLTQADLVRNYIAMTLPTQDQEKIFEEEWCKIESLLTERRQVGNSKVGELTGFIRHYLAMSSRVLCSEENIYARFRDRIERDFKKTESFMKEIKRISRFSEYYDKLLRPDKEQNREVREALQRLNILDIQIAYPFLLMAYNEWKDEKISHNDFISILNILENYMIRRFICNERISNIHKAFPSLWNNIMAEVKDSNLYFTEALKNVLFKKGYPSDRSVRQSICKFKLYNPKGTRNNKKIIFILEKINYHLSEGTGGYTVLDNQASIEHILPQKPNQDWKNDLGENLDRICQDYLHTLGNLTLVTGEWNKTLSNYQFSRKQEKLKKHALKLNSDYFYKEIEIWDENSILSRANFLADKFLEIWSALGHAPPLSTESDSKPKSVIIIGQKITIPGNTWRELMKVVTEWAIKNRPDKFEIARNSLKTYFSDCCENKNYSNAWHQLSNGVWLNRKGSAKTLKRFCSRLLMAVGISDEEWNIELGQTKITQSSLFKMKPDCEES